MPPLLAWVLVKDGDLFLVCFCSSSVCHNAEHTGGSLSVLEGLFSLLGLLHYFTLGGPQSLLVIKVYKLSIRGTSSY